MVGKYLTGFVEIAGTSSNIQTTATLSGQCGQGVTIELIANDGESGTFTGNADCTLIDLPKLTSCLQLHNI